MVVTKKVSVPCRTSISLCMYFYSTWYAFLLNLVRASIALGTCFYCTWHVYCTSYERTSFALGTCVLLFAWNVYLKLRIELNVEGTVQCAVQSLRTK